MMANTISVNNQGLWLHSSRLGILTGWVLFLSLFPFRFFSLSLSLFGLTKLIQNKLHEHYISKWRCLDYFNSFSSESSSIKASYTAEVQNYWNIYVFVKWEYRDHGQRHFYNITGWSQRNLRLKGEKKSCSSVDWKKDPWEDSDGGKIFWKILAKKHFRRKIFSFRQKIETKKWRHSWHVPTISV